MNVNRGNHGNASLQERSRGDGHRQRGGGGSGSGSGSGGGGSGGGGGGGRPAGHLPVAQRRAGRRPRPGNGRPALPGLPLLAGVGAVGRRPGRPPGRRRGGHQRGQHRGRPPGPGLYRPVVRAVPLLRHARLPPGPGLALPQTDVSLRPRRSPRVRPPPVHPGKSRSSST